MRVSGGGRYYEMLFRRRFDAPIKLRHIWLPLGFLLVTLYRNQHVVNLSAVELACTMAVTALCFLPLFVWASKEYREPPAFQCFCAIHFPYYAYPVLSSRPDYMSVPEAGRTLAVSTVLVFLLIVNVIYHFGHKRISAKDIASHFRYRYMPTERVMTLFTLGVTAWSSYTILDRFGYIRLGSLQNIAYLMFLCGGMVSIWTMMRLLGEGKLSQAHSIYILVCFALGLIVSIGAGTLIEGLTIVMVATVAYSLGRTRVPWIVIILAIGLFAFLNLGKGAMRDVFWKPFSPTLSWFGTDNRPSVLSVYEVWVPASWDLMWNGGGIDYQDERSLMNRASLMDYHAKVVNSTPEPYPYLYGDTYWHTPLILIPRFLWPEKPKFHKATTQLCVRYGFNTEQGAKYTTIAVGSLAESWANFGWLGIVLLAICTGVTMRMVAKFCYACHPHSLRGFMSVVWVAFAFQIEPVVSVWVASFGQAAVMTVVVLYPLTRRYSKSRELADAVFSPRSFAR